MIELYQFRPKFGVPNLSSFCLKLETWLKISGLEYKLMHQDDPRTAPLGKLPYIKDKQKTYSDSSLIIDYLSETYSVQLDAHLSDEQKAISHACQVMIEERLYWAVVYHRWIGDCWPVLKASVFSVLPPVIRQLVPILIQKQVKRDLYGQGLGRHSVGQINAFAASDLEALSVLLADKPFLLGDSLSSIDASMYAMLCEILHCELETPLQAIAEQYPNLVAYELRLGNEYFPEYYQEK